MCMSELHFWNCWDLLALPSKRKCLNAQKILWFCSICFGKWFSSSSSVSFVCTLSSITCISLWGWGWVFVLFIIFIVVAFECFVFVFVFLCFAFAFTDSSICAILVCCRKIGMRIRDNTKNRARERENKRKI